MASKNTGCTITIGGFCAILLSVMLNKSFWWALLHFFFGWLYVIYAFIFRYSDTTAAIHRLFS